MKTHATSNKNTLLGKQVALWSILLSPVLMPSSPAWAEALLDKQRLSIPVVHTVDNGVYQNVVLKQRGKRFVVSQMARKKKLSPKPSQGEPATYSEATGLLRVPNLKMSSKSGSGRHNLVLKKIPGTRPLAFKVIQNVSKSRDNEALRATYRQADVANAIRSIMNQQQVVGLSAAVVKNGELIWSRGFGFANQAEGIKVTPNTPFRLGSVSKAVLGVALLQHENKGKIRFDQPVNRYLPFKVRNPFHAKVPIRIRHLVEHASGIKDGQDYDCSYQVTQGEKLPLYEVLGVFPEGTCDKRLSTKTGRFLRQHVGTPIKQHFFRTAPGEKVAYSNVGSGLVAYALEKSTGKSIKRLVQEGITDPLGMVNTGYDKSDFKAIRHASKLYWARGSRVDRLPDYHFPTFADGGLHSSAIDLARLLGSLANRGQLDHARILSEEKVSKLFGEPADPAGSERRPVFWEAAESLVYQDGSDPGVASLIMLERATGLGLVVLANTVDAEGEQSAVVQIGERLLQIGLDSLANQN